MIRIPALLSHKILLLAVVALGAMRPVIIRAQSDLNESASGSRTSFLVATNGDALLVPVRVFQKDLFFSVDTGCAMTCVDDSFRAVLSTRLRRQPGYTADGQALFDVFAAPRATLNGEPIGVAEISCADFSLFRAVTGYAYHGVIGMDFLARRIVQIDFDRGKLAFLPEIPGDAGVGVPIAISDAKIPTVKMNIVGAGELTFDIDTGLVGPSVHVDANVLDKLLRGRQAISLRGGLYTSFNKTSTYRSASLRGLELAGFTHDGVVASAMNGNRIGLDFLSRYVVTFDFPRHTMYVKPGRRINERFCYDLSGLHILRLQGNTVIHSVDDGSVAEGVGVKADDIIEQIGDRPAASLTMFEIRKTLCFPGRYSLSVRRGDALHEKELVLREPLTASRMSKKASGPPMRVLERR